MKKFATAEEVLAEINRTVCGDVGIAVITLESDPGPSPTVVPNREVDPSSAAARHEAFLAFKAEPEAEELERAPRPVRLRGVAGGGRCGLDESYHADFVWEEDGTLRGEWELAEVLA